MQQNEYTKRKDVLKLTSSGRLDGVTSGNGHELEAKTSTEKENGGEWAVEKQFVKSLLNWTSLRICSIFNV